LTTTPRVVIAALACAAALGVLTSAQDARPRPQPLSPSPAKGPSKPAPPDPAAKRERPVPFKVGETLVYDVSWSAYLTAGTATVAVRDKRPSFDSLAYYIVAEGRPTPLLSKLYTLYYKADSLLDAYTLLPQRGSLYSEEGRRRRMTSTRFDQAGRNVHVEMKTATVVTKDLQVPPYAQDSLSAIYVLRALPLGTKLKLTMPVVDGDDVYRVRVAVIGHENITTPLGQFLAWKITPTVLDARGKAQGRAFSLWISDDSRRLPLRMEADMSVGRFVLSLREARG
jgi:hypothetical protein